jgi:MFS transporter, UMF1 family
MQSRFKARLGWALYDWAAQPFFTIIFTFVFGPYFVNHVTSDPGNGQAMWASIQTYAGIALALSAPLFGAYADIAGRRKPWVLGFSALCIGACACLWFAVPNAPDEVVMLTAVALVIAIIGAELAIIFNNAMLPGLAEPGGLGKLSGFGWAMGYLGALIALPIMLWLTGQLPGIAGPSLDQSTHVGDRLSGPFVAIWFLLFMAPFMLWTPDKVGAGGGAVWPSIKRTLLETWTTLRTLHHRPNLLRYLLARMCYYDGLNAIFAFGGVYAAVRFDWATTELGIFGIIILLFGVPGSLLGGWLDDRIGSKNTLYISVSGLFVTMLAILSIGDNKILFVIATAFPQPDDGLFATPAEHFMMVCACALGAFAGPSQAASRSLIARIAPAEEVGKYFGLFAMSGKATSFVAPATIGALLGILGDRWAYGAILVFLLLGLVLLIGVHEAPDDQN